MSKIKKGKFYWLVYITDSRKYYDDLISNNSNDIVGRKGFVSVMPVNKEILENKIVYGSVVFSKEECAVNFQNELKDIGFEHLLSHPYPLEYDFLIEYMNYVFNLERPEIQKCLNCEKKCFLNKDDESKEEFKKCFESNCREYYKGWYEQNENKL